MTESRWEAAPAVLVVSGLQLTLALISFMLDWKLWSLPWWVWTIAVVPESILLIALAWDRARAWLERIGHRRNVAVSLLAIISIENTFALVALLGSLISGHETSGGQLVLKGDVGDLGTVHPADARVEPHPPPPDFRFPQQEGPEPGKAIWRPLLFDYIYVSFTNSIAFSPTDTMPLTRRAKALMLAESSVSAVAVLLVAARAVNIFK